MEQRIALVTGGNRGIGYATIKALLKQDYIVVFTARNEQSGRKAQSELQQYGEVHVHALDVSEEASVEALHEFVEAKFGRLDVLVNNAGINYDTWHSAENADLNEVQTTLDTNLMGPWRMAQAFIPMMKQQGYGRIVNVSSGAGAINGMGGGTPGYSVSKAALNVLTIKLAANVSTHNILINAVCPGWVRTDMGGQGAPRSPEEGAASVVWAAVLPDGGPSGKFFRDGVELSW